MRRELLQEQALHSSAHLVAALVDRRFGAGRLTAELKDCIDILRGELDELGLLTEYKQENGNLIAWRPEDDALSGEVLGRASKKDDPSSTDLTRLPDHRVLLPAL